MTNIVLSDGRPACTECIRKGNMRPRPKRQVTMANGRKRWLSYCQPCQTDYERRRRENKSQMYLSAYEKQLILQLRREPEAVDNFGRGRHRAAS
jgi:hypothetical protein